MAHERGFTLVEVLVALAILAVALTAAFRTSGIATDIALDFRERLLAGWVAENRLAEYGSGGSAPEIGERSGTVEQGGIAFAWRERIAATATRLFRIDVQVFLVGAPERALVQLVGYVPPSH